MTESSQLSLPVAPRNATETQDANVCVIFCLKFGVGADEEVMHGSSLLPFVSVIIVTMEVMV
jgi:hypothetical protein